MKKLDVVSVLLVAVAMMTSFGCSPSSEPRVEAEVEAPDPLESIACTSFKWVDHPGVANRAGMVVPVIAGGATLGFQLSTGAEVSMIPGGSAKKHGIETLRNDANGKTFSVPMDLQLGGAHYPGQEILVEPENSRTEPAGTIGLDLLAGKVVVLDLAYMRFCVSEAGAPEVSALLDKTEFTAAKLRDGKLFVEARLGDETLDGLMFNTGASAFPLQVDLELWQQLTGRNGDEESNTLWEVTTRSENVTFVGAPALGKLQIGQAAIDVPMVFFQQDRPSAFTEWPVPVLGLLGNALFYEYAIVLDLRADGPRFGILSVGIS